MKLDEVLLTIEQVLLSRQLNPVERLILCHSWNGTTYSEMTRESAYGSPHLKDIGCRLWHELSVALGQRVTKKNLQLVLKEFFQKQKNYSIYDPSFQFPLVIEDAVEISKPIITATEVFFVKKENLTQFENHLSYTDITTTLASRLDSQEKKQIIPFPGAPVAINSPLYINRILIEEKAYTKISEPGCVIRIQAPTKKGKSSLLNRIITRATALQYKTVYLNFQEAEKTVFTSLEIFLRWFASNVSQQLNLSCSLDEYWDEDIGSKVSCKIYFQEYLLQQINTPVVLAMDELHLLFEHPEIAQEFLPMLRFWHELAQRQAIWQNLRLVMAHATEVYIPLKLNQSPFNVGLAIQLPNFNLQQVQDLALRYSLDWASGTEGMQRLAPLVSMVDGHPYLVNLAFYHLHQAEMSLEDLLVAAPTASGIYSHYLRSYLALLRNDSQLIAALQQVLMASESVAIDAIAAYKLESMGIVKLKGNTAKPSCQLYRAYFQQQLL